MKFLPKKKILGCCDRLSSRHGHCTSKLTAAMITYTRPAQDGVSKVSQNFLHVTLVELNGRSNKEAERKFGVGRSGREEGGMAMLNILCMHVHNYQGKKRKFLESPDIISI